MVIVGVVIVPAFEPPLATGAQGGNRVVADEHRHQLADMLRIERTQLLGGLGAGLNYTLFRWGYGYD